MTKNGEQPEGVWSLVGLLTSLGASVVISVAVFTFAGVKVDSIFGIAPAGLIAGVALGVACGVGAAYRLLVRHIKDIDK
mgnify:CR=1 FL=1